MIKKLILLCLGVCLLLSGCAAEALPSPTDRFFINDFADVMSEQDELAVYNAGVALQAKTDAQLVLVTVDSLGGYSLEDYALELARTWQLGDADKDNGLLLLFCTDGPHTRVEVGYGLEGALPDSKAGRILDDHLVPHYDDSSAWSAALEKTYGTYVNEVYAEYGLTQSEYNALDYYPEEQEAGLGEMLLMIAAILVFALLRHRGIPVFIGGFGGHRGGFGGHRGGGGFSGGGGGFGGGGASR